MENLAGYIVKTIQETRTGPSDNIVKAVCRGSTNTSPAELARREAKVGFLEATASYLHRDKESSVKQKGLILAEAFTRSAVSKAKVAQSFNGELRAIYISEAQRSSRIAEGLRQASDKLQDEKLIFSSDHLH